MATAPTTRTRGKAKATETSDDEIVVEFRGLKFVCPKSRSKWPTRAHQAFQRRNNADGIEYLLGPQQWDALNQVAPTMGDFWEFFGAFTAVANAGLVPDKGDDEDDAAAGDEG